MNKKFKFFLLIFFSIISAIIINILFFSEFDLRFLTNRWHKQELVSYNANEQVKLNMSTLENNNYITTSDDSQIIINNINGNVNEVDFDIDSNCSGIMQLYYTDHKNEEFQELNSFTYDVNNGENDYHISLSNENVFDLRIDPVNENECLVNVSNINVNYSNLNLFQYMNLDKILILGVLIFFVLLNIFYDRKKLYSFMFNKRIIIGILVVFVGVLCNYNGSSILEYNDYIQKDIRVENNEALFGESRSIRSDEWNVSSPISLSQTSGDSQLQYYNNYFRAENTDMYVNTSAPVLDIVAISKPFTWGYFILGGERGFSFWWVARIVALFLVTIEFGMLITKKNKKLSVALAFLITLAPAVQWWYSTSIVELLVFGQLSVLLVNKFFESKTKKEKFLTATILIVSMLSFFASLYPAWEVPLAIVFGLTGLYYFIEHVKKKKITIFDLLMMTYVVLCVGLIILRFYLLSKGTINSMSSTVYPGERFALGGKGFDLLFNYFPGLIYSFVHIINPCEPSLFISLFPIPAIISIIILAKSKKKNKLLIILLSLFTIYSLYSIFGFPGWLSKITLTYFTQTIRMNVIVHLLCVYIMIISINEMDESIINKKNKVLIALLMIGYVILSFFITKDLNVEMFNVKRIIVVVGVLLLFLYSYLKADKKKNTLFLLAAIIVSIMSGLFVNPIIKGTNIMYDKPYAKEVRKLQSEDPGNWIVIGSTAVPNYTAVQGVPVINTVNMYPDLERMKLLDPDNKYENIYNRYAHISIELVETQTRFELLSADFYVIYLNVNDLKKLDVKYVVCPGKIEYKDLNLEQIYYKSGLYIYKFK